MTTKYFRGILKYYNAEWGNFMFSNDMLKLGQVRSVIRDMFEYGNKRAQEIGRENVYDFSLGNPSVPAPKEVNEALIKILTEEDSISVHSYTSAAGDIKVRTCIANFINSIHKTDVSAANIYLTVGAAAALTISIKSLVEVGDEIIVFAPFFPEYRVFIETAGAKCVTVKCRESDFQIDFDALESAITEKTKAVIINSPCNPSGVVFSEETIIKLSETLEDANKKFGREIFIIADEPYRELVFDNEFVPFVPNYYDNTVVCYSFSKSLSLPGERIGYILVNNKATQSGNLFDAVCGAGRALGFVCAPTLFQKLIPYCIGKTSDISVYKKNRDILLNNLSEYGFSVAKPQGAFYLFLKALEPDAVAFCEKAKQFELLLVPGDSFGYPGYVRISYCVSTNMIERSLPAFKKLAELYKG